MASPDDDFYFEEVTIKSKETPPGIKTSVFSRGGRDGKSCAFTCPTEVVKEFKLELGQVVYLEKFYIRRKRNAEEKTG